MTARSSQHVHPAHRLPEHRHRAAGPVARPSWLTVTMVSAFVVLAIGFAVAVSGLTRTQRPPQAADARPPSAVADVPPSPSPNGSPAPSQPPAPAPSPRSEPATSGQVATVTARVTAFGSIDVVETVRVPPRQVTPGPEPVVTLRLPAADVLAGPDPQLRPRVTGLAITVDAAPAAWRFAGDGGAGSVWQVVVPTSGGALWMRYRLDGAVVPSHDSQPSRAVGVIAPLTASAVPGVATQVRISGQQVLNVACPLAPPAAPALCGRQDGNRWTATLPVGSQGTVVLQVDLPRNR
jgi:hypothetical protein